MFGGLVSYEYLCRPKYESLDSFLVWL